jgi:hypothetical protein
MRVMRVEFEGPPHAAGAHKRDRRRETPTPSGSRLVSSKK